MLLIEVAGKRIMYSGDFRLHGRKSELVKRLMEHPPTQIDALIMEGTNLGSDKPCSSEADLEDRYCELFSATAGRVRSEEHTSELQSLMRISYAVFCLKKQNHTHSERTKSIIVHTPTQH